MEINISEIKARGKTIKVLSTDINNKTVVVTGKWIKMAAVHDEEWLKDEAIEDPEIFIEELKHKKLKADIFTFVQRIPHTQPKYKYRMEWDNAAAIPITSFEDWWEKRLPQVTRKSIRRGSKRGVIAKVVEFNDELVNGIIGIHNDTPTRQGRPFAYYGKDFDGVKKDYGTYLDNSEFIGAYFGRELVGIIKLVYMGEIASIMQILTKTQHYDKRPTNILIAKAVEICEKNKISYLIYGKYIYGRKSNSSLTEFKRRNGFQQIDFPRYYIPLTPKGKVIIKLKLHRGLLGMLPASVISFLRNLRSKYYQIKLLRLKFTRKSQNGNRNGNMTDVESDDN